MKAIEINEKQKEMLLEMCKALFPEYKNVCFYIDGDGNNDYDIIIIKDKIPYILIHWFEFCLTNLAEKIIATFNINEDGDKIYKRTLNDDLSKFYLESLNFSRGFIKTHPVDYLYKQFKELKL